MYRDQDQREFARRMRNEPTAAEKMLWQFLRGGKLGEKFRRQAAIGKYIVDFVCLGLKLIVELDGESHLTKQEHDQKRDETLQEADRRFEKLVAVGVTLH